MNNFGDNCTIVVDRVITGSVPEDNPNGSTDLFMRFDDCKMRLYQNVYPCVWTGALVSVPSLWCVVRPASEYIFLHGFMAMGCKRDFSNLTDKEFDAIPESITRIKVLSPEGEPHHQIVDLEVLREQRKNARNKTPKPDAL